MQHLIGLADAGRGAEEDLEPAAAFLLGRLEQRLGRRPLVAVRRLGVGHRVIRAPQAYGPGAIAAAGVQSAG